MSLSQVVSKVIGIILAIVGLALLLSLVGIHILGVGISPWYVELVAGILFLASGIYIINGGNISI